MNTERIKYIRDELEITQETLSKMLGCTRSAYSLCEINKNTIPLLYLNKLSNILSVNIDYIVDLSNTKNINFKKVEIDRKILKERIRQAKNILITQKLTYKLNTTHSFISAYKSGKTAVPTLFMIEIVKITKRSLNCFLKINRNNDLIQTIFNKKNIKV